MSLLTYQLKTSPDWFVYRAALVCEYYCNECSNKCTYNTALSYTRNLSYKLFTDSPLELSWNYKQKSLLDRLGGWKRYLHEFKYISLPVCDCSSTYYNIDTLLLVSSKLAWNTHFSFHPNCFTPSKTFIKKNVDLYDSSLCMTESAKRTVTFEGEMVWNKLVVYYNIARSLNGHWAKHCEPFRSISKKQSSLECIRLT